MYLIHSQAQDKYEDVKYYIYDDTLWEPDDPAHRKDKSYAPLSGLVINSSGEVHSKIFLSVGKTLESFKRNADISIDGFYHVPPFNELGDSAYWNWTKLLKYSESREDLIVIEQPINSTIVNLWNHYLSWYHESEVAYHMSKNHEIYFGARYVKNNLKDSISVEPLRFADDRFHKLLCTIYRRQYNRFGNSYIQTFHIEMRTKTFVNQYRFSYIPVWFPKFDL